MRKPEGYDSAEARAGGFAQPKAGPCILGIIRSDIEMKDGVQRLILQLDIASGTFKHYYKNFGDRVNKNKLLRVYQDTDTEKGLPYFKGLIKSIEESNPGFVFDCIDEKQLIGKFVGGVLREEESVSNGKKYDNMRIFYLCSVGSVERGEHKVPAKKLLPPETADYGAAPAGGYPYGVHPDDFDQSVPSGPEGF